MEENTKNRVIDDAIRKLTLKELTAFLLFTKYLTVKSKDIGALFNYKPRTRSKLCSQWVQEGFFVIVNNSKKARTYQLSQPYQDIMNSFS